MLQKAQSFSETGSAEGRNLAQMISIWHLLTYIFRVQLWWAPINQTRDVEARLNQDGMSHSVNLRDGPRIRSVHYLH